MNHVIIPLSGWDRNRDRAGDHTSKPQEIYWTIVFRNANGVLRNVSSAGEYARRRLRECEGLCDALLHLMRAAVRKNDMDNKSVENCVCTLRNLSYRCQEVEDPEYDKHAPTSAAHPAAPASRATGAAIKGEQQLHAWNGSGVEIVALRAFVGLRVMLVNQWRDAKSLQCMCAQKLIHRTVFTRL